MPPNKGLPWITNCCFSAYTALPAHAHGSRQRQLHECLRTAIRDGTLGGGARLPATRTLAQELGVSRNTVLYAYDQLATEGLCCPAARGTVVAEAAARTARPPASATPLHGFVAPSTSGAHPRCAQETPAAFAPGVPRSKAFPATLWRRLLDRAWRSQHTEQLNYAPHTGEPALR